MTNRRTTLGRAATLAGLALLLIATAAAPAAAEQGPWARTETREPCANFDKFRQPYFGDTHVHTAYSSDAVFAGTREDPRGGYRFAKGEPVGLPPFDPEGNPTRTAQLRRPLDFTAITDHAEQFGEIKICLTPGLPGYDSADCVSARNQIAAPLPPIPNVSPPAAVIQFLLGYGALNPPQRFSWCGAGGANCLAEASLIWDDTRAAAEQYYDRTSACSFTSFVAYEWSGQPLGNNLHRNVIFRNEAAPSLPISYMEWNQLKAQCLEGIPGCDVLAIPHNPNASGGLMFAPVNADNSPLTAADAAFRSSMEPMVELTQHKGDSECRPGLGTTDELCGYEKLNRLQLFSAVSDPNQAFPPLNYVRNALKEGLLQELTIGVNPFELGLIGSTDDHNAAPGSVEEQDFGATGHIGLRDRDPISILARVTPAGIEGNPGGLAVVWAEENSRDALFTAMRRREVYATSGTRPILRFFAGREPGLACGDADFVEKAYRGGVPMGSDIGPVRGGRSPHFGVLAFRDPGTPGSPGALLQRVQIVKGWVDQLGQTHEKVFEVAGTPDNGATVDTSTCTPQGAGAESLCAVWDDPEFDSSQRSFYYARVLENPTCRWSTYVCNDLAIDCSDLGSVPAVYLECCNAAVPKTIQERAWSSPIWYHPQGVVRLKGVVRFSPQPQRDVLHLALKLGGMPFGFDPTGELRVTLRDGNVIYDVTIPPGTLQPTTPGHYLWKDPTGSIGGLKKATFVQNGQRAVFSLTTVPMTLPALDRTDHFVELTLRSGLTEIKSAPLWLAKGRRLVASN